MDVRDHAVYPTQQIGIRTVQDVTSLASPQQRIYGSRVPSVRGCLKCGIMINHSEGCKHIICRDCGHTKLMHQREAGGRRPLDARWRRAFRMSVRPRRLCQKRSLKSIFQREMLWGRGRGRRDVPALLWKGKIVFGNHQLGRGQTGYSYGVVKMDARMGKHAMTTFSIRPDRK